MLDPHIRTALKPVPGTPGVYSVSFRAPDRHGVFKFIVDYKRKGYEAHFLIAADEAEVILKSEMTNAHYICIAFCAGTQAFSRLFKWLWCHHGTMGIRDSCHPPGRITQVP